MSTGRSPFCRFLLPTLAVAVAVGGSASPAVADIVGAGPDETIQQAYGPLAPTVNYSGAFIDANDVDYLAFRVASAGETLRFTVSNTLRSCNSPDDDSCPLYATLMDQTNSQVGGDTSSAGTVATVNDTESFDWTFTQAGTYYLLMESNGNLTPGQPTYRVRYAPVAGASAPAVRSLTVARRQRGFAVRADVVLGQPATSLQARLFALGLGERQSYVTNATVRLPTARTYRLSIRLPPIYRRRLEQRHSLSLLLKFTITRASGAHLNYTRRLTLSV